MDTLEKAKAKAGGTALRFETLELVNRINAVFKFLRFDVSDFEGLRAQIMKAEPEELEKVRRKLLRLTEKMGKIVTDEVAKDCARFEVLKPSNSET